MMHRERALKVVLVLVGLLFTAMVYPLVLFVKQEPALAMMMSLYATLGIFLLVSVRNPSANRSLIAFTAWSSFVHAMLMAGQAFRNLIPRGELWGRGCPHRDRCSPDRAGSGKAAVRASFCCGGVGLARFENGDTTQSTWQTSAKSRRGARGRTDAESP
jgi:hypothetical protein